ncbi:MAG TPA: c-type cytochrome [Chitinophagaceae bacterium]|jgi:cytochrome c2|nr:c-type cytochrome [Chitinophagaceae bacterium]
MIPDKYFTPTRLFLLVTFFVFSFSKINAQDGKAVFTAKCASCHIMGKDFTGPNLHGVLDRWGGDTKEIKTWILNWKDAVAAGYAEAEKVQSFSATEMQIFKGQISDAELDAVVKYITEWTPPPVATDGGGGGGQAGSGGGALIFGIISLIMALIALVLMQVNSNLKKLSDDTEGILRPEPVPFYKNKVYIALFSIVLFIVGGYYTASALIDFQRQKHYQPVQPIFYSHKVHAGINQINCLYCHGAAMDSKQAAIPSVNVCMNCHKTINAYEKGPKLFREDGTEVNGTREIEKLFSYAGFDPKNAAAWDPSKAKPIDWTRIHNLPDHVYFNHSQHIKAGKVQCQSCHGEITNMDEVYQFSELSMGWCINCHRNTKVDFYKIDSTGKATGNKFYSIYEKFHNDIKSGKMDSVTVKDIGGLECQKCHY